jgi:hypothetical protein
MISESGIDLLIYNRMYLSHQFFLLKLIVSTDQLSTNGCHNITSLPLSVELDEHGKGIPNSEKVSNYFFIV